MKKIILHIITIVFFFFISCEDVLDKAPLDIISDEVVWDDPTLANAYIIQVYSEMDFLFRDLNGGFVWETDMLSLLTDEARDGYDWHTAYTRWKPGLLTETGGLLEWWGYTTIRKINEFLLQIESSTIQESEKKIMIGKIKFARAFSYFAMVKRYGGIPIITVPQDIDAPDEELYVSRNKEVDVYDFIINELDEVVDLLPESYSNSGIGYPTKYAALALKSRVAMYAASIAQWGEVEIDGLVGIPSDDAQRFWQLSYDASKAIIESGNFQLYNNYPENKAENFYRLFLDENNEEVIFSKQFTGMSGIGNNWDAQTLPCQFSGTSGGVTNVYLEMVESFENIDGTSGVLDKDEINSTTWNLADELFANKDPRFYASVFFEGSYWQEDKLENWSGLIKPDGEIITDGSYEGKSAQGRNWISTNGYLITGFLVKKYCAANDLLPSEWGGETEVIKTSAITGQGIDELLETLLTVAELHEYKANPNRPAIGTCLEAELHEGRGVVAKLMVQNGNMKVGDVIVCGAAYGRVKAMYDTLKPRRRHEEVGPSCPVNVTGLNEAPGAGDRFYVLDDITQARHLAEQRAHQMRERELAGTRPHVTLETLYERLGQQDAVQTLNIILRADVRGSIEAIRKELTKLEHPEVQIRVLQATVGGVTEADVHLADASDAVIIAFNVVPDEGARQLADQRGVQVRRYDIIYQVTDELKAALEGMLKPEKQEVELGRALVKQVFQISRMGTVAGCQVLAGLIQRDGRVRVIRDSRIIGDYQLDSLRREKNDIKEVRAGMECGMKLRGFNDIKEGDILEVYRVEEVRRTLASAALT